MYVRRCKSEAVGGSTTQLRVGLYVGKGGREADVPGTAGQEDRQREEDHKKAE